MCSRSIFKYIDDGFIFVAIPELAAIEVGGYFALLIADLCIFIEAVIGDDRVKRLESINREKFKCIISKIKKYTINIKFI